MKQQNWFDSDPVSVCDIVLFTKVDSALKNRHNYGMIVHLECGQDSLPRRAKVRYRNVSEDGCRETNISIRSLIKITEANDSDLTKELGTIVKNVDLKSGL